MTSRVIQVVAVTAFSILAVGCATSATSAHGPKYSAAEVERALQNAERSALTRLSDSVDVQTAQAARHIAVADCR